MIEQGLRKIIDGKIRVLLGMLMFVSQEAAIKHVDSLRRRRKPENHRVYIKIPALCFLKLTRSMVGNRNTFFHNVKLKGNGEGVYSKLVHLKHFVCAHVFFIQT